MEDRFRSHIFPASFSTSRPLSMGNQSSAHIQWRHRPTERDYVEITVKREPFGVMSGYLHERVKEGGELDIAAPAGRLTFTGTEAKSIVLIGGGVGITPLI